MSFHNKKGPSRVSSWLNDGFPTDKKSFLSLKDRLELQREKKMNVGVDNPEFIKLLKYEIRGNYNEEVLKM